MPTVKGVEGHGVLRGMPFDVVYKRGQRGRPLAVPTVLNNPATRPYPDAQLFGGRDALQVGEVAPSIERRRSGLEQCLDQHRLLQEIVGFECFGRQGWFDGDFDKVVAENVLDNGRQSGARGR